MSQIYYKKARDCFLFKCKSSEGRMVSRHWQEVTEVRWRQKGVCLHIMLSCFFCTKSHTEVSEVSIRVSIRLEFLHRAGLESVYKNVLTFDGPLCRIEICLISETPCISLQSLQRQNGSVFTTTYPAWWFRAWIEQKPHKGYNNRDS